MIKLLKFLITGHIHKWEIHDEINSVTEYGGNGNRIHYRTTILKCKVCGIIKVKKYKV